MYWFWSTNAVLKADHHLRRVLVASYRASFLLTRSYIWIRAALLRIAAPAKPPHACRLFSRLTHVILRASPRFRYFQLSTRYSWTGGAAGRAGPWARPGPSSGREPYSHGPGRAGPRRDSTSQAGPGRPSGEMHGPGQADPRAGWSTNQMELTTTERNRIVWTVFCHHISTWEHIYI